MHLRDTKQDQSDEKRHENHNFRAFFEQEERYLDALTNH